MKFKSYRLLIMDMRTDNVRPSAPWYNTSIADIRFIDENDQVVDVSQLNYAASDSLSSNTVSPGLAFDGVLENSWSPSSSYRAGQAFLQIVLDEEIEVHKIRLYRVSQNAYIKRFKLLGSNTPESDEGWRVLLDQKDLTSDFWLQGEYAEFDTNFQSPKLESNPFVFYTSTLYKMEDAGASNLDDNSVSITAPSWINIKDNTDPSVMYINGNNYINFGSAYGVTNTSGDIKIFNRDGKVHNIWTQRGTADGQEFFKIRVNATNKYSSTSDPNKLTYEYFFLQDGRIWINVQISPTELGGTVSAFGQNLDVPLGEARHIVLDFNSSGEMTSIEYGHPYEKPGVLLSIEDDYYGIEDGALKLLEGFIMSQESFYEHCFNMKDIPIAELEERGQAFKVLQLKSEESQDYKLNVSAIKQVQSMCIPFTDIASGEAIGLAKVETGGASSLAIQFSFDNKATWQYYNKETEEFEAAQGNIGNSIDDLKDIPADKINPLFSEDMGYMKIIFVSAGSKLKDVKIYYKLI